MDSSKLSPAVWVPTVYFGMGLPYVALSTVSVLIFSDMQVSNTLIAFWTSLVMLPWTLKPLWSPLIELFKTKRYFVLLTQLVTGILFGLWALSLPMAHFFPIAVLFMFLIALSGSTHDIAGDGIYLSELTPGAQAKYIGWQGASYNLAKILTTGALVYLAGLLKEQYGVIHAWMIILFICATLMISLSLYHLKFLPTQTVNKSSNSSVKETFSSLWSIFKSFFLKKWIVWYICFIIFYRFAEGMAIKIVPLFLKASVAEGGLGLSVKDIGLIYGGFGAGAFILGSMIAGYYISYYGLKRTLFSLCICFNIPFLVYFLLAFYQPDNLLVIGSAIVFEYFGYGFGFVGLTLFMMQQVSPGKHPMAHYAFASGIMNLGVMIPGMISGYISDLVGYQTFFIIVLFMTIPAFFVCKFVPFTYDDAGNKLVHTPSVIEN